jgi:arylsulfate sulfotransferase
MNLFLGGHGSMMGDFRGRFGALLLLVLLTGCGPSAKLGSINAVPPTTTVALSGTSFDFGDNLVGNAVTQTAVTVTNTGAFALSLNPTVTGDHSYSIVAGQSCGGQLAAGASCVVVVNYTPISSSALVSQGGVSAPTTQTATINLNYVGAAAGTPSTVSLTGMAATMTAGTVTATANPQVALYTITPPFAGNVTVSFGPTTAYGLNTWTQATPSGGGPVSIEVAGMLANTTYHLRASVQFANGLSASDVDQTFATGATPGSLHITATTAPGQTPQPGIEMLNPNQGEPAIVATDLSGNVIWTYNPSTPLGGAQWYAPKQLSNGDYIALAGSSPGNFLLGTLPPGSANLVREFDLAGNTVKEITIPQLNTELAAANYNLTLFAFHHDVTPLPNGHWLVLANTFKNVTLNGQTTPTQVLGDVVVDLDTNLNVAWVWNSFDHLDVNRQGADFPDWTHTNAVVYSKDDGNLLISMRHQSWVIKVDYNNGAGTGNVIWRLGEGGDFTLVGGTDPTDWFYAQHGPAFTTSNTTGTFGLTLMDNGDFRIFPAGVTCGVGSAPACLYSTVPVFQIDEVAKTATLEFHQIFPTSLYSFWGGNADGLANGDVESDLCGLVGSNAQVSEVNQSSSQPVWTMKVGLNQVYRAYRLPSLYPGVQW